MASSSQRVIMPPRYTPRIYHLQIKSHKLSIYLGSLSPFMKVKEVKEEVLDALKSNSGQNSLDILAMDPPELDVSSIEDFEIVRQVQDKGKPTGTFEVCSPSKTLYDHKFTTWELVFIQFRDKETGELLPVTYTLPSVLDERLEEPEEPLNKGKRKMEPDDEMDDSEF